MTLVMGMAKVISNLPDRLQEHATHLYRDNTSTASFASPRQQPSKQPRQEDHPDNTTYTDSENQLSPPPTSPRTTTPLSNRDITQHTLAMMMVRRPMT